GETEEGVALGAVDQKSARSRPWSFRAEREPVLRKIRRAVYRRRYASWFLVKTQKTVAAKIGYRREVNRQSPFSPSKEQNAKAGTDSEKAPKEREEERRGENRDRLDF
ncbi:hypothetical protein, partial [Mesotoga sp.]|uniref:hypothetical protein n=1 Tax=Mesotoga sp. TaxID=2053577 RepID=UPI001BD3CF5E